MDSRVRAASLMCAALVAMTASVSPVLAAAHGPGRPQAAGAATSLAWKLVPSPNGSGSLDRNLLNGVSCPSASTCIAVGDSSPQSLAELWNGTAWTVLATPQLAAGTGLNGVSCISVQACTAVGGSSGETLVETWNGTAWTVVASPNVASGSNSLNGVSCVSAQACTAVGDFEHNGKSERSKTLIESWNGTAWAIVPSPQVPPSGSFDALTSVSCVSAQDCTAVGIRGGGDKPLIETWNGTVWKVVPGPRKPYVQGGDLDGVSCLSASDCTAVGAVLGSTRSKTLVETWNGTAWKVVPSPNAGSASAFNNLNSVSCVSAQDCTAVGTLLGSTRSKTLIETWDGTAWTVVPSPNTGSASAYNYLDGVSCASADTCSAVGNYGKEDGHRNTLAELGISSGERA
jgi:hypothetical protein